MADRPIQLSPSILAADFTRLGDQVIEAERGGADRLHIDVMDGQFVPNITMGPLVVAACKRATALPLDIHLMIVEPDRYLSAFAQAGAARISVHVETCPHLHRTLTAIRESGVGVGVAINPHTPTIMIESILHLVDIVLVMTVNPGFGGQSFIPHTLGKIERLRSLGAMEIEVDGGITPATAPDAVRAGATSLVAGSAVFSADHSVAAGLQALRNSLIGV